jgi:hypothetical protein
MLHILVEIQFSAVILKSGIVGNKTPNSSFNVRFDVFTAMTMKNAVFWDVTRSSIIRATRIGELGKTLAVTSNRRPLVTANVPSSPILVTLVMEALGFLRNVESYKHHTE